MPCRARLDDDDDNEQPLPRPERRADSPFAARSDLNLLVANYLFTEGYLSAAENFAREAGLSSSSAPDAVASSSTSGAGAALGDVDSIRSRMEIRRAVLRGEVESALDQVVDLDLEVRLLHLSLSLSPATAGGASARSSPRIDLYYAPLSAGPMRGCNDPARARRR